MRTLLVVGALVLGAGVASAQNYVGDQACAGCHANMPEPGFFDSYVNSGHPWKIFRTQGNTPDGNTWPHTDPPPLPIVHDAQLEWSEVEYVIGNYYWKARFIDDRGFIYTGDADETTQWNLQTEEFVPYHAGEVDKPFDCGRCHTTGYDPAGNQHGLAGLVGTWTEDGVRCEACHGPSSDHVANPSSVSPPGGKDCAECHFRDAEFRMPWKGGFMRHHQQSEDMSHSPHDGVLTCLSCHDPHKSVVYNLGGTTAQCSDCHPGNAANSHYLVAGMENVDCIECHMPHMGKSGQSFNPFTGDVRGHLFQIMTDPVAAADNVTDIGGSLFWNQEASGDAFVTLDYACLGCHEDVGDGLTLMEAASYAFNIHNKHPSPVELAGFSLTPYGTRQVTVEWRTSIETNHRGFYVHRALAATGGFERLHEEEIRDPAGPQNRYKFVDKTVEAVTTYAYRLEAVDNRGDSEFFELGSIAIGQAPPREVALRQNWPNPFNPSTAISFSLAEEGRAALRIYSPAGQLVRTLVDGVLPAQFHRYEWDGTDDGRQGVTSGVYLYRLETSSGTLTRKLVLMR